MYTRNWLQHNISTEAQYPKNSMKQDAKLKGEKQNNNTTLAQQKHNIQRTA